MVSHDQIVARIAQCEPGFSLCEIEYDMLPLTMFKSPLRRDVTAYLALSCIKLMLKYKGLIFIIIALLFSDCRFIVGMH